MINRFEYDYAFLGNFYTLYVSYEGGLYPSVGHAFAAARTKDPGIRMRIATAVSAREVINLERKLPRHDWYTKEFQLDTMCDLLKQKFSVPALRKLLLDTKPQELVYGNSPDEFWGIDESTGRGENQLGLMLMQIREHT